MNLVTRFRIRRRLLVPIGRKRTNNDRDLLESLVHIHRLVMSGYSLDTAISHAVHSRSNPWIEELHVRMTNGQSLRSASRSIIDEVTTRTKTGPADRDVVIALHVLSVADSIGGQVADQLGSMIDILDERSRDRRERRTQASSAAASMRMLTMLPIFCLLWILFDSNDVRDFLFRTTGGWACLTLGIGSNIIGRLWIEHETAAC